MKVLVFCFVFGASLGNRCTDQGGRCIRSNEPCGNQVTGLSTLACSGWEFGKWQCCLHQPSDDADCGLTEVPADGGWRIQGGKDAKKGAWPWIASLQVDGEHHCGASILNEHWLVTAAHCVMEEHGRDEPVVARQPHEIVVIVGQHSQLQYSKSEQYHTVAQIHPHEDYVFDHDGVRYDIALLKLDTPIRFNKHVRKVCLAKKRKVEFFDGKECWIAGWGKTYYLSEEYPDILQQAKSKVLSHSDCMMKGWANELHKSHICVDGSKSNACPGDSGGPLVCRDGNRFYLLGAASFGNRSCWMMPSVYTRISSYLGWMAKIMNDK